MVIPLILYDILIYILVTVVYGGACFTSFYFLWFIFEFFPAGELRGIFPFTLPLFLIPSGVIFFIITVIFEIWIIRLCLPKIKEGHYKAPDSKMFYIWTLHLTLNRLISIQPIKNIILYSVNLRYLAFKALGGNIAYGSSISADVDLVDISMLTIGKGCVIGSNTAMSAHFINKDKITFGKVKIGDNVNVGAFCHIAPNTVIGDNSWIGSESKISPLVRIGSNCNIEPMSVILPGIKVEDNSTYPSE